MKYLLKITGNIIRVYDAYIFASGTLMADEKLTNEIPVSTNGITVIDYTSKSENNFFVQVLLNIKK